MTSILDPLDTHPPIGTDCEDVTHIVYQSIPNATAAEGSEQYVGDPDGAFGAGGMEIRPRTDRLADGGRYLLETGGPVPTWLPVEIRLDPGNDAITINTLDGHVLRAPGQLPAARGTTGTHVDFRRPAPGRAVRSPRDPRTVNGDRDYDGMGTGLPEQAAARSLGRSAGEHRQRSG